MSRQTIRARRLLGQIEKLLDEIDAQSAPEFYTVSDLAEAAGVTRQNILAHIKRGNLKAVKIGNQYRIDALEFRRFLSGSV